MEYVVKNWSQFQHYRDRNPPWIKLHFALLSSRDWVTLDDASRVLAIACMLIASRNKGRVPDDPEYVKRVAYLNKTPNFKPLIQCGFLEPASTMLADASALQANARPETETETETEKRRVAAPPFDPASVQGLDPEAWKLWIEHRTAIKKPIRPHSLRDAAEELAKLGSLQLAEVKRARAGGWQGLHPEKPKNGQGRAVDPPKRERPPTESEISEELRKAAADNQRRLRALGLSALQEPPW